MSTKFPCEKRLRLILRKSDGTKPILCKLSQRSAKRLQIWCDQAVAMRRGNTETNWSALEVGKTETNIMFDFQSFSKGYTWNSYAEQDPKCVQIHLSSQISTTSV